MTTVQAILQSPAFWICLLFSLTDSIRDKMNLAANKWPNSGFRIMRRGWRVRRVYTKAGNAELEINGWRLVVTVDFWHINKWLQINTAGAFVLWHVPTVVGKALAVVLAWGAWKIIPKPQHWN